MGLSLGQIGHLPDLSDKLGSSNIKLAVVEIAEWKTSCSGQYLLNYVAGRATLNGRECLISASYRSQDGFIFGSGIHTISTCFDYTVVKKLV